MTAPAIPGFMAGGGRRNGRTLWYRHQVEAAAMAGEHVHAQAPDGMWCVTSHPVGFLWARMLRGARR